MLDSPPFFRPLLLTAALALLPTQLPAGAPRSDQDQARAARARQDVLPLERILAIVERHVEGRIIDTELERDDGRLRYELELLLPDGRVIEIEIDARTGDFLKLEGQRLETALRRPPQPAARPDSRTEPRR